MKTVGRDVGRIIQAISLMRIVSLVVATVTGEFYAVPAFGVSATVLASIGAILAWRYRDAEPPEKREAMFTAATAWVLIGVLGSLPFLLIE